ASPISGPDSPVSFRSALRAFLASCLALRASSFRRRSPRYIPGRPAISSPLGCLPPHQPRLLADHDTCGLSVAAKHFWPSTLRLALHDRPDDPWCEFFLAHSCALAFAALAGGDGHDTLEDL